MVTALSLAGVVGNLGLGVALGEPYVDVLIRDIGLTLVAFGRTACRFSEKAPPESKASS